VATQGSVIIELFTREDLVQWEEILKHRVIHRDVAEKYHFHKILGEGASGRVFLASFKSILEEQGE